MKTKMNAKNIVAGLNVSSLFNPLRSDHRNQFNGKLWFVALAVCAMLLLDILPAWATHPNDSSSTTVSGSPNPSTSGQSVTFTATVTRTSTTYGIDTPAGTVTFKEGTTTLGTGTLSGSGLVATATFSTSSLSAGNHTITASYPGNGSIQLDSSSGNYSQTVNSTLNATTTVISGSPNPSVTNQSITFTATVTRSGGTATPSGNVVFRDGATAFSTNTLSGSGDSAAAAAHTSALTIGSHTIAAEYAGDSNFTSSTNSVVQIVTGVTTNTGTPIWWLQQLGYTTNFELAALEDPDNDGANNWEEYVAGTNPTNADSVLIINPTSLVNGTNFWEYTYTDEDTQLVCTGRVYEVLGCVWQFPGADGRRYNIETRQLNTDPWTPAVNASNLAGTPVITWTNWFSDSTNSTQRFRVKAQVVQPE